MQESVIEGKEGAAVRPGCGQADPGDFLGDIARRVYGAPWRYGFSSEDEVSEALVKYRGRLLTMASRDFDTPTGRNAYVDTCLRYLARTVRRNRKAREEREAAWLDEEAGRLSSEMPGGFDDPAGESDAGNLPDLFLDASARDLPAATVLRKVRAVDRRLVFLYLKCAWEASDSFTLKVARRAGVPVPWLAGMVEKARARLECDRSRREMYRERRNAAWFRIRLLERRMAEESVPARRIALQRRLAREKALLERYVTAKSSFKPVVPNSVIAELLGVPKGTVDSGLYYMKRERPLPEAG